MLVLVPAIGGAALLLAARRIAPARIDVGAAAFAAISLAWAAAPMALWTMKAALSLGAAPMRIDGATLTAAELLRRLALPALLLGTPLWLLRDKLPRRALVAGFGVAGVVGLIAVHGLYRLGLDRKSTRLNSSH